ncbi:MULTISPECIES: helix-turn-helix transcriptional regulator [Streptomyces]|uniref:helix-turn-helix transcriptional regulator n=1 Tax=Streptomyces TaxID=1883 RepID=UPI00099C26DB|nr:MULTISPECIES: helix-turn-helix transcriptional regulator [Streptomyces]
MNWVNEMKNFDQRVDILAGFLHRTADQRSSWDAPDISDETGSDIREVEAAVARLAELQLLLPDPGHASGYSTTNPKAILHRLVSLEQQLTDEWHQQALHRQEKMQTLLRHFPVHGLENSGTHVELLTAVDKVNTFIEGCIDTIEHSQLAMHPGGLPSLSLVDDMLLRDQEVLDRGARIMALYSRHLLQVEYVRDYLTEAVHQGAEVRLAEYLPIRLLILDDGLSILPIDPQDSSQGAIAIHSSEVTGALKGIFSFHWTAAETFTGQRPDEGPADRYLLTSQERAIARMLAIGVKDEAIARQLGISPRTLSRVIAMFLEKLGVQTRFQAAIQLVRAGLIDVPTALPAAGTEVG